jgi:hypothetical protein
MRSKPVVFITPDDRKLLSTITDDFGLDFCSFQYFSGEITALYGISSEEDIN